MMEALGDNFSVRGVAKLRNLGSLLGVIFFRVLLHRLIARSLASLELLLALRFNIGVLDILCSLGLRQCFV